MLGREGPTIAYRRVGAARSLEEAPVVIKVIHFAVLIQPYSTVRYNSLCQSHVLQERERSPFSQ